jgi:MFS family permease
VALTFLLGLVLYADRSAISVLAPAIRRDFGLSPVAMGGVFMAFVWGYAAFSLPVGWVGDRFGSRKVLAVIVVLWSTFTSATAATWNLSSLIAARFLFGAAESGATPNVSQTFARWIPLAERARAQGFFFAGMSAGGAVAPPLVTLGLLYWGWKTTFVALGGLGLGWAAVWYWWYRDNPADHRAVNSAELALLYNPGAANPDTRLNWGSLMASRNLWAILLMYFTYGYTGYIYISWFPSYLIEARQLPTLMVGILAGLPSVVGMIAKPLGGWASDWLTKSRGVVFGRRAVGMFGFGLAALAVLPGLYIRNPYLAVAFLAVADGAAALAHGVCFAVCIDTGLRRAGTISGLMLTAGSIGNAASAFAFGFLVQYTGSWEAAFLIGMAANVAGALLWLGINPKEELVKFMPKKEE